MTEVRQITAADAAGLTACLVRCYGDSYPKRTLYQPTQVAALIRAGAYQGVVAAHGAEIIGHIGVSRPTAAASVVEAGTTIVDPRHRGGGLMGQMSAELRVLLDRAGVAGFIHFPTTAHTVMQRASISTGGRETGVLLGYLPPTTRDRGTTPTEPGRTGPGRISSGRLAVTVVYQPLAPAAAQAVHLPDRYAELITRFAAELDLPRTRLPSAAPAGPTVATRTTDGPRGLVRLTVAHIGADLVAPDGPLVHVDLPLNDPAVDSAVEALRADGFAYAAWLPGWAGHDVLRLQRLSKPTQAELDPDLHSPAAAALLAVIRS